MIAQFFTIGLLMLLTAMLPGPDFAIVAKNTLMYSRRSGLFTTLGIGFAVIVHITYCSLGLAVIITNSSFLFNIIKYGGACYLIYLGITSVLTKQNDHSVMSSKKTNKSELSNRISFQQGFLCNLLNPKVMLFFLALFTVIIKPETSSISLIAYAVEMVAVVVLWFYVLIFILSHATMTRLLQRLEKYIAKSLGLLLIIFGVTLTIINNN